tara:strand:+ start:125 stop:400 length:276 start_codon:yes stop_codon:yes gene_type:complete
MKLGIYAYYVPMETTKENTMKIQVQRLNPQDTFGDPKFGVMIWGRGIFGEMQWNLVSETVTTVRSQAVKAKKEILAGGTHSLQDSDGNLAV